MDRIPILRMGEFLLVTIQVDMHDQLALTLQDDLAERISATSAKAVLIDIRDPESYQAGHIVGAVNVPDVFSYLAQTSPEGLQALQAQFAEHARFPNRKSNTSITFTGSAGRLQTPMFSSSLT